MIDPFVLLTPVLMLAVIALLRFVGCLLKPPPPLVLDAVSNSSPDVGQTQSWMHTASGPDRLLVVVVHGNDQARHVVSVTYGGTQLNLWARVDGGTATFAWVEMWYLTDPPTGQHIITVTLDASDAGTWTATGISFTNVDQTNPLSPAVSATRGDAAPSVVVMSSTNDLVLDAVTYDDTGGITLTVGMGQTQLRNDVSLGQVGFGVSTKRGADTITMSWTLSAARPWQEMGVSVREAT